MASPSDAAAAAGPDADDERIGGLTLEAYAVLSAELAEHDGPSRQAELLAAAGATEAAWLEASTGWLARMGEDVAARGADATLVARFSEAFSRAQDGARPLVAFTVDAWAALNDEMEGPDGDAALARRQLSLSDYFRLIRHWTRAMTADDALARSFEQARAAWRAGRTSPR